MGNPRQRILYYGDNLEVLRNRIGDDTIDLCYIDPPFNSKRNYFQIYNNIAGKEDRAQAQAFVDTWRWDDAAESGFSEITTNQGARFTRQVIELIRGLEMVLGKGDLLAYLVHMSLRVTEIYRALKPTGSFYLHCDPTASHYLKLILDAVFCSWGGNFQNEIIWNYTGWNKKLKTSFESRHDIILFYSKSNKPKFNSFALPWESVEQYVKVRKQKVYIDESSRSYVMSDGGGGKRVRRYLDEAMAYGRPVDDVWEIDKINNSSKERMGYPTQKPEALLERIIKASSNPGDLVLDAYCGCGTTVAVSERLERQWIGIDITYHSISLILKRLADAHGEQILSDIHVDGIPRDMASARALANREDDKTRKEFEKWAILTYSNNRAVINEKKGADKGIDGVLYFASGPGKTERMVIQVKSGGASRGTIATLNHDRKREKAELALLITMDEPTRAMKTEAKAIGTYEHPLMGRSYDRVRIVTVREIIEEGVRNDLPLTFDAVKPGKRIYGDQEQLPLL